MTVSIKLLSSHINFHGRSIVQKQTDEREKEKKKKKFHGKPTALLQPYTQGLAEPASQKIKKEKKGTPAHAHPAFPTSGFTRK